MRGEGHPAPGSLGEVRAAHAALAAASGGTRIGMGDEPAQRLIIALPGVDAGSPLGKALAHAVRDVAVLAPTRAMPEVSALWRRCVRDTALDWSAASTPPSSQPVLPDVLLDLHGQGLRPPGRHWRIVDGAGNCVLRPLTCLTTHPAAPSVTSLYLIESEDGVAAWVVIAEAHISARRGYRSLLDTIGRTVAWLVGTGVRAPSRRPKAWHPHQCGARGVFASRMASLRARLRDRIGSEIWAIGRIAGPVEEFVRSRTIGPASWTEVPARDGFIADPFAWPGRDNVVLYERYRHGTGLGSIEAMVHGGSAMPQIEPLDLNVRTHLSYPFTFQTDLYVVCLPEMATERRQVMYVLGEDRTPRALCTVAENVAMFDPTLFRWGDLFWIAYNDGDRGLHENLCLLFASRVEGPWTPHPLNPVKVDVRSSRPAGAPFEAGGVFYRPAQDCSDSYGCALAMNRIIVCTPSRYEEEHVATLLPDPNGRFPDGLHTFSVTPNGILIDGKRTIIHWHILWQRLSQRLRRPGDSLR